jgi:hypothetical protein
VSAEAGGGGVLDTALRAASCASITDTDCAALLPLLVSDVVVDAVVVNVVITLGDDTDATRADTGDATASGAVGGGVADPALSVLRRRSDCLLLAGDALPLGARSGGRVAGTGGAFDALAPVCRFTADGDELVDVLAASGALLSPSAVVAIDDDDVAAIAIDSA